MSCEHTGAIEAAIERLAGAHGVNFANMRETCPRSAWVAGPGLQDD